MIYFTILLSLLVSATRASWLDTLSLGSFSLWPQRRFQTEGFLDAGSLISPRKGMVAAVGDVNGDQVLDLFLLSPDQHSLDIYLWDKSIFQYIKAPEQTPLSVSPRKIVNVVPADLNHDGRLDLLIMSQDNPGSWWSDDGIVHMSAHLGLGKGRFKQAVDLPEAWENQPMLLDAQGNMTVDLLGVSNDGQKLRRWRNTGSESEPFQLSDISTLISPAPSCKLLNPHSNAFVDLDGDCLADLFLTCQDPDGSSQPVFQIYINKKDQGFQLAQSGKLPRGAGQVSFADVDRDGTIDMVFPVCSSSGCSIDVAYNHQIPLCSSTQDLESVEPCRDAQQLCHADPNFSYDLSLGSSAYSSFSLEDILPSRPYIVTEDSSFAGQLPLALKLGDYNKDGYPDILLIASDSSGADQGSPVMLESVSCTKKRCGLQADQSSRRAFAPVGVRPNVLDDIDDAKVVSFVDIDEQGSLDIMVQTAGGDGGGVSKGVTFVKNNIFHDAFFLKALVVNGACGGICAPQEENAESFSPSGVSYAGASYKFTVFDPKGQRRAQQVGQLPSTSYMSLLTPYSYFGLGRTNNYVENLFVGSTRHQQQHFTNLESLIPNSQVLIDPYQPPGVTDPRSWIRQLYLHPGDWIPGVVLSLVGAMVVLGGIILFLHLKEQREDEAERKKNSVHINFDAL